MEEVLDIGVIVGDAVVGGEDLGNVVGVVVHDHPIVLGHELCVADAGVVERERERERSGVRGEGRGAGS